MAYTFPSQVAVRPARGDIRPGDTAERIFHPSLVSCQRDNFGGFLYWRNIVGLIFCELKWMAAG